MIDAAKSRYLGGFINDCREFQRRKRLCSGINARFARDRGRNIWVKATKNIPPIVKSLHRMAQNIGVKGKNMIENVNGNKLQDHVKENQ